MLQKPWTPARVRAYQRVNTIIHALGFAAITLTLFIGWHVAHLIAETISHALGVVQ